MVYWPILSSTESSCSQESKSQVLSWVPILKVLWFCGDDHCIGAVNN